MEYKNVKDLLCIGLRIEVVKLFLAEHWCSHLYWKDGSVEYILRNSIQ